MDIVDEDVPPRDGQGGQVMSADQCERCGRYLYSSRESETSEERDLLLAEVEALRADAARWIAMRDQIISGEDPPEPVHAVAKRYNDELSVECLNAFADAMIVAQQAASGGGEG